MLILSQRSTMHGKYSIVQFPIMEITDQLLFHYYYTTIVYLYLKRKYMYLAKKIRRIKKCISFT